jgi:hypothetical protein
VELKRQPLQQWNTLTDSPDLNPRRPEPQRDDHCHDRHAHAKLDLCGAHPVLPFAGVQHPAIYLKLWLEITGKQPQVRAVSDQRPVPSDERRCTADQPQRE